MREAGAPTRQELVDRFRPRNLRRDSAGDAVMYDYTVPADGSTGQPDPVVRWRVLTRRLCGLCGDQLGDEVAFIGTSGQAHRRRFSTPGMHVDCARFAFAVCPYMSRPDWLPQTHTLQHIRTPELVLVVADSYRYSPWRWWKAMKLLGPFKRANYGCAKVGRIVHEERYPGRREMLAYLNAQGGCPAHREQSLTGSPAHTGSGL